MCVFSIQFFKRKKCILFFLRVIPTPTLICQSLSHIIWKYIWSNFLAFYLAFYLASMLTSCPASILTFSLASYLAFFGHMFCHMFWHAIWHSIPAIHLASILTFLSGILSGISSDFVFVVEVRPGNTLIRSSQLRTLGLHLKLAVAISREGPPTGAKF